MGEGGYPPPQDSAGVLQIYEDLGRLYVPAGGLVGQQLLPPCAVRSLCLCLCLPFPISIPVPVPVPLPLCLSVCLSIALSLSLSLAGDVLLLSKVILLRYSLRLMEENSSRVMEELLHQRILLD